MDKEKRVLLDIVDRFTGKTIAVWGDFILDEYLCGTTRRVSREAPVLILRYLKKDFSLGGAGNSVLNLKALGANLLPIGVVGRDEPGEQIIAILRAQKIPTKYIYKTKSYQTPIKTRILAGEENTRKQQILRIDREAHVPSDEKLRERLSSFLLEAKRQADALLISDYNYLTVEEDVYSSIMPAWKGANLPVTLDSRFRLLRFKGVTAATPNEPEAEAALQVELGDDIRILKKTGSLLLKKLQSRALLITRGSRGMAMFEPSKRPYIIPVHGTTDIVDVTGAGDTVISVFTLALACGANFREASALANYAGGVVVMKKGTATLTVEELKEAISS
ncbi:MAG: PfkB family carbohydrate kinase [Clostridiales bacterium]|nr:PfkB family carbohydrate kinase [Clostridiales bacterium]